MAKRLDLPAIMASNVRGRVAGKRAGQALREPSLPERMMRVLNARIKHANECANDKRERPIPPASQFAWRAVARQMENLRERYRAMLRKEKAP
jgi:hypothetical protein